MVTTTATSPSEGSVFNRLTGWHEDDDHGKKGRGNPSTKEGESFHLNRGDSSTSPGILPLNEGEFIHMDRGILPPNRGDLSTLGPAMPHQCIVPGSVNSKRVNVYKTAAKEAHVNSEKRFAAVLLNSLSTPFGTRSRIPVPRLATLSCFGAILRPRPTLRG
ncbi:MAG: hypothetical protein JWR25_653 [Noviherbaspirillum sp.]|nr:hypothetical protein [Noviherbaspirillum sp.]